MIPAIVRKSKVSPFGASNKRLTSRAVQLRDGSSLTNATLVPLFRAQGTTVKVALLSPRTRECWMLDWRPGLVKVPLLRRTRVDIVRAERQGAASGEPLWLYDGAGLVELALVTLCPGLAVRNAAEFVPATVQGLIWRRDLSGVSSVWMKDKSQGSNCVKWKPEWLADADTRAGSASLSRLGTDRPVPPKAKAGGRGWVLDPAWAR